MEPLRERGSVLPSRIFGLPTRRVIIGLALFGLAYPILMGIADGKRTQVVQAGASRPTQRFVTAPELFVEYQANEVAADNQYRNVQLHITGDVEGINKDFTDNVIVLLATSNPFLPVHARLRKSESQLAASLSKGMTVNLSCVGAGMVLGSPVVKDCALARPDAEQHTAPAASDANAAMPVDADTLALSFLRDPEAATRRYGGRHVAIPSTMRIIRLDQTAQFDSAHVVFRTSAGLEIKARFQEEHITEIAAALRNALGDRRGEDLPAKIPSHVFAEHKAELSKLTCFVHSSMDGAVRLSDCGPTRPKH